jgi:tetratricopeptide (TPR) repeat protein
MVFKRMFRGGTREDRAEPESLEDLIVLERYEEAEQRLKARLRENPDDLHSFLKLAEVHTALRRVGDAVEDYLHVADEYARDGFYEKGIALLGRARKLIPADDALPLKIAALEQIKALEHKRAAAVEGVRQSGASGIATSSRVLALQRGWTALATSRLIGDLATDQVRRLFSAFDFVNPEVGDVLAREDEQRPILFLLVGAQLEAAADGTQVRRFGPRDILGETALFERGAWPVTLTVTEPGLVLALDRAGVERVLAGNPDPRGLLAALRARGIDRELEGLVRRLRTKR